MQRLRGNFVWAAAALLAGALLRAFFILHHPRFGGDATLYGELAANMLSHHVFGFAADPVRPTLIRLPGYPLFLAACFLVFGIGNYLAVLWVQAALDLLGCVLLASLAGRLAGPRAARSTLWLAALCPFTANYTAVALTETCTLFAVVLALFSLERWLSTRLLAPRRSLLWSLLLGVALAAAVLVRPDQGLLAAALLPAMLWAALRDRSQPLLARLAPVVLTALLLTLPLALWGLRNWRVFHVIQPLAPRYANDPGETVPFGFQRWYRTWALDYKSTFDIYWNYDGAALAMKDLPPRAFDNPAQRARTAQLFALYNQEQSASPLLDRGFAALAAERVRAHPFEYYLLLPVGRELNMWLRPRTELMKLPMDWWLVKNHPAASAFEIAYALLNAAYLVLAILGWQLWRRQRFTGQPLLACALLGFVLLRCLLLLNLDNSEPRYTLECFPVVFLLAGLALCRPATGSPPSSPHPS